MITDENFEKVEQMYEYDLPKYIDIVSENIIKIKAEQYEGAGLNWIKVTVKDVINYFRQDNSMGCAGMSGCRTLSTFTTDWRMVDGMAQECLSIFKLINKDGLSIEGKKFGMELK